MYGTNAFEKKFLDTMRGVDFASPGAFYVGLYLSNPGEDGGGVEITYPGYERQRITFSAPAAESGGIGIKNDTQISFPESDADAGTVTHIGILDSRVGGTMYLYGKLTEDLIVYAKENPVLLPGEVVFYLLGNLSAAYKARLLSIFRGQGISGFATHVSLWNGDPEGGGAELSGANYARVPLAFSAPAESESGQMAMTNTADVRFNRPSSDWGTWTHTAFFDALSGGEPVWVQEQLPHKTLLRGHMPWVRAGEIRVAVN